MFFERFAIVPLFQSGIESSSAVRRHGHQRQAIRTEPRADGAHRGRVSFLADDFTWRCMS